LNRNQTNVELYIQKNPSGKSMGQEAADYIMGVKL
jgi:hypothetical protein